MTSERLVDFDEIDLGERQPCFSQSLARGGHRPDAHDVRLDAGISPTDDAPERCDVALFNVILARDDERRRAVHDARCVARGDEAVLAEGGRQFR